MELLAVRMMIVLTVVAALLAAVWPLIVLRRWTRLHKGQATLRGWDPALVIVAQSASVLLWAQILFTLPATFYLTYRVVGNWWFLPAMFVVSLLFILIPGAVTIIDMEWLRLHRIPPHFTMGRIWAVGGSAYIALVVLGMRIDGDASRSLVGILLVFATVTTLFLTCWSLASQSRVRE